MYVLFTGDEQRWAGLVSRRCTAMPQLKTDRDMSPVIQKLIDFCNPFNDKVLLSPFPTHPISCPEKVHDDTSTWAPTAGSKIRAIGHPWGENLKTNIVLSQLYI